MKTHFSNLDAPFARLLLCALFLLPTVRCHKEDPKGAAPEAIIGYIEVENWDVQLGLYWKPEWEGATGWRVRWDFSDGGFEEADAKYEQFVEHSFSANGSQWAKLTLMHKTDGRSVSSQTTFDIASWAILQKAFAPDYLPGTADLPLVVDGRYMVLGKGKSDLRLHVFSYLPGTPDSMVLISTAPFDFGEKPAAFSTGHEIYVMRGNPAGDFWKLDLSDGSWQQLPAFPGSHPSAAQMSVSGGKALLVERFDSFHLNKIRNLWAFDLPTSEWQLLQETNWLNTKSVVTWTGANGAYLLAMSGFTFGGGTFKFLRFDPANDQFEEIMLPDSPGWFFVLPVRAIPCTAGVVFGDYYSFFDPEKPEAGPVLMPSELPFPSVFCLRISGKSVVFMEKAGELWVVKEK